MFSILFYDFWRGGEAAADLMAMAEAGFPGRLRQQPTGHVSLTIGHGPVFLLSDIRNLRSGKHPAAIQALLWWREAFPRMLSVASRMGYSVSYRMQS